MGRHRFILISTGYETRPRNRARAVVLEIPDSVKDLTREKAKEFVLFALRSSGTSSYPTVLCEHDTVHSPEISAMFDSVDWDSAEEIGDELPTKPHDAFNYIKMVDAPVLELEPLIASVPDLAYLYAMNFAGRFPAGERAIAKNPSNSLNYASSLGTRIRDAEDMIAENDSFAAKYGLTMKKHELWDSWTEEELSRTPVWMYQYAKDHMNGALPESLHNLMYLKSVTDPDNLWIKKYFKAKKYRISGV